MTRRSFRRLLALVLMPAVMVLAVLVAPSAAFAQDADSDLPTYPGPFDTSSESGSSDAGSSSDEVLGQTVDGSEESGSVPVHERSVDHNGEDAATRFIAPDIQPSTAPATGSGAAGGGTGGGLANTGSTVEPIIAISVGMLALGGSTLVGSRRRLRDFFA